jgi:hypothetical protein
MDANSNNRNTNGVGGGGANDGGNNMQDGGGGGTQGGTGGKGATPGKKFIIQRMNDAFFTVMVELLKRKHISKYSGILKCDRYFLGLCDDSFHVLPDQFDPL